MPVYLDAIPDLAPKIRRPDTRRWLFFLAAIIVVGGVLTFWQWSGNREGFIFWFTALGLPFCLWGLIFSLRRFDYKCDQVWAASWDRERALLAEQETTRGQRVAHVINTGVVTQFGSGPGKLLSAVKSPTSQLTVQPPRAGGTPVRHSRLSDFQDKQQSQDLDAALKTMISQLKPALEKIPGNIPCELMIDCDIAGVADAEETILQRLAAQTGRKLRLFNAKGFTAFDIWLDEMWERPSALIILSAVVRSSPQEGEGEAIVWLLLLNRRHLDFPDAVSLHRPEKGHISALDHNLDRALLWCQKPREDVKGTWTTGKAVTQGGELSSACEASGLTFSMTEDNRDVDQTTGYTGKAAPWLAIILAATAAQSGGSQVVVAETNADEIWVAAVTPGKKAGINQGLS
ncbi:hypothetical protein FH968_02905 [Buttiauxella sp. B2]|uniref:hypothetical protein n=1 Tax=Buttiauxella sp. B2 TaxID=2587812 RepID=UPI0011212E55|nr:hypothetical protein [Buttiauxella sp. B2]TNV23010.1 hypothetical protein FH968_02905 [Buttiauxella sp. B2]